MGKSLFDECIVDIPGFPHPVEVQLGAHPQATMKHRGVAFVRFNHPHTHYSVGFTCPAADAATLREQLSAMAPALVSALNEQHPRE